MDKRVLIWTAVLAAVPIGLGLVLWSPLMTAYGMGVFAGAWIGHDFAAAGDRVRKKETFPAPFPEMPVVQSGGDPEGKEDLQVVRPPAGKGRDVRG